MEETIHQFVELARGFQAVESEDLNCRCGAMAAALNLPGFWAVDVSQPGYYVGGALEHHVPGASREDGFPGAWGTLALFDGDKCLAAVWRNREGVCGEWWEGLPKPVAPPAPEPRPLTDL